MYMRDKCAARHRAAIVAAAAAVSLMGLPHFVRGATKTWVGGTSVWSTAANWNPVNRPGATDFASLRQSGAVVTYDVTTAPFSVGSILIENGLTVSQATSTTQLNPGSIVIGGSSAGTYTLSAGTLGVTNQIILGQTAGGAGSINVGSAGLLSATTINVGSLAAGSINQTGGSVTVNNLSIGTSSGTGFYRLDGGLLNVTGAATLGANGSFTSTGGGSLASTSTFHLAGGVASGTLNNSGTFISDSGTLAANVGTFFSNSGTFIYNGGDNSNFAFGNSGRMIFNADWTAKALFTNSITPVDFGAHTINLTQGVAATNIPLSVDGNVALNGGTLNANAAGTFVEIGISGNGSFTQNSGQENFDSFGVGSNTGTTGTYTLCPPGL